ncbi:MAG: helix-turn-helix domain-containing protein [Patescibacteria group bacterium]
MTDKKLPVVKHQRSLDMLTEFGLSRNEALIYTYLLERGTEAGGSKIAIGTRIHRQYVYIGIKRLGELSLIEVIKHGKQNKYKAVGQNQIEKIANRKVVEAGEIVRELNTFSLVGHEQNFEVYQGSRQLQNFEIAFANALPINATQYVIGGATDHFYHAMEDRYDEFIEIVKNKKLITNYIGPEEELNAMKKANEAHPGFIYRTIKDYPKGLLNTVIRGDSVVVYSFAKPPLVYVIKSETVVQNYKQFFMMLWNMAGTKA